VQDAELTVRNIQEKMDNVECVAIEAFIGNISTPKAPHLDSPASPPSRPPSRRNVELQHKELGIHRLGLASLGPLAQGSAGPHPPASFEISMQPLNSINYIETKLGSMREKLEYVEESHLNIDDFKEFAHGLASAHQQIWSRLDDLGTIQEKLEDLKDNQLTIDEFGELARSLACANERMCKRLKDVGTIQEELEDVKNDQLTIDEFGELARSLAGASERMWKRMDSIVAETRGMLTESERTANGSMDAATLRHAEVVIEGFFEQLANMEKSPVVEAEDHLALQSWQAEMTGTVRDVAGSSDRKNGRSSLVTRWNTDGKHVWPASILANIQTQVGRINELVTAARASSNGKRERSSGVEALLKIMDQFREFASSIEIAVSEALDVAHTTLARIDNCNIGMGESKVSTTIEAVLNRVVVSTADVQARVKNIERVDGVLKGVVGEVADVLAHVKDLERVYVEAAETSEKQGETMKQRLTCVSDALTSKADVARVALVEDALVDVHTRLEHVVTVVNAMAETVQSFACGRHHPVSKKR
jgi:hypothetical protein